MDKGRRRAVVVSVLICILALGVLLRSHAFATVRLVDALLLFVAGMSAGVALVQLLVTRRP
jgi:hypothetical protein